MSCGCGDTTPFGGNDSYNNLCNTDTPYPIVSNESVPSLISNLTLALYGQIQKDISSGKVVWIIPCDPNNTAYIANLPREPGEGLMCYFIRYFNTVYPNGVLGIPYGGTGATNAPQALTNLGAVPITRQIITELSSGLAGGGDLTANRSLSIANTAVTPGTYGSQKKIPVIHVNARGQLTEVTEADAEGFAQVDSEVITASAQQTVFNLTTITYAPGTDNLAVYRNGLRLLLNLDYIETNSTTVTLTRGVAAGNQLLFESGRIIGQDISAIITRVENQTATAQQTVFTLTIATYVPGSNSLSVYRNGLKLVIGVDYTETNSNTVTLTSPAALGDQFEFDAGKILTQTLAGTSVDFLQAGTGAVTRNMQDKARESVSVLDFGADPTGATDSTLQIQAALNTGRVVYLPAGTYQISSALTITQNNSGIRGDGYGSFIRTTSATADIFTIGNGSTEITGLLFSDFVVWATVAKTAGFVFNCRYVTDSIWRNIHAGAVDLWYPNGNSSNLYSGYYFNRFSQCSIEGGQIVVNHNGVTARGNTDQSFGGELSLYGGIRIFGALSKGIYLGGGCGGVYIERVDISECFRGIHMDDQLASATNREVFLGPTLTVDRCSGWGINIEANGVAFLEATGPWVSGCGTPATGEGGIRVAPSAAIAARWSNLRVNRCYYDGIQISDGAHVFSGGYVQNCGHLDGDSAAGAHGILLAAISQVTITGMEIFGNGNSTRGYGIYIEPSVNNYNIQSNAFFSNGQKAIYTTNASSTQIIRDNRGWVTENSGTANILNGTTSVAVNHGLADVPTLVQVTAAGVQDGGAYWFVAPGSFTATQFTLTYSTTAGAQRDFFWRATRGQA